MTTYWFVQRQYPYGNVLVCTDAVSLWQHISLYRCGILIPAYWFVQRHHRHDYSTYWFLLMRHDLFRLVDFY